MKASDRQEGGQHYKDFPIQPAEFCQRNRLNWCESNVVKYVSRHRDKKGAEDIRKAIHYLELLLEWEYPQLDELYLHGTLCDTCARPDCAKGEYPATKDGGCEGYLRDLPDMGCTNTDCCNHSPSYLRNCGVHLPGAMRSCEKYTTAQQDTPTAAERPAPHTDPAVNCKECAITACMGAGANITLDQGCDGFKPKEAAL